MQPRAHNRDEFESVWPRIAARVDEAGRRGAALIVLPEGTVPAYVIGNEPIAAAQLRRAADALATIARAHRTTIVYGGAILDGARTFNAAIALGPDGEPLGSAKKAFLWHFDRRWFAPGETFDPIPTPLGNLGVLVCADGRIPTIAATLVERGADVLVMPTAWVTSGRDPGALENAQADLLAAVRARENGVPFIAANKCGFELASVAYCGKSLVIDATGAVVARGSQFDEETVFADVAFGARAPRARGTLAEPASDGGALRAGARIAFTVARGNERGELAQRAAIADADVLLAFGAAGNAPLATIDVSNAPAIVAAGGVRTACVGDDAFCNPRGLVSARLRGIDLFVWHATGESQWHVPFARARALELRAYVVAFAGERAFAVDPDGVVVAGTFDGLRVAAFAYERARAAATFVAPGTDVLAGLRRAEDLRASTRAEHARA